MYWLFLCVMAAAARLVAPQHGSREDAEAGAPKADPQTQLPLQTPRVLQWERAAVQPQCEALTYETHSCSFIQSLTRWLHV